MTAPAMTARGCQSGPTWCVNHRDNLCFGEVHSHGGVFVFLYQSDGDPAQVCVDGHRLPVAEAGSWARTFAQVGAAEVAATVRRLGELAGSA